MGLKRADGGRFGAAVLLIAGAAMALPSAVAHPRFRHHGDSTSAVIVIGKPRPLRQTVVVRGRPAGVLDLNVKPKDTRVWVDGNLRGKVDEFDGHPRKLHLVAGDHRVKLVTPDGVEVARVVKIEADVEVNVGLELR